MSVDCSVWVNIIKKELNYVIKVNILTTIKYDKSKKMQIFIII